MSDSSTDGDSQKSKQSSLVNRGRHGLVVNEGERDELRSTGEEAWTNQAESLAISWADEAQDKYIKHSVSATRNSRFHKLFGLPGVVVPIIFAIITPTLEEEEGGTYGIMAGYVVIAILNSINSFFNFDKRQANNEQFAARFSELTNEVRYQLFKSRRFRIPSDEFLARLQTKLNMLTEQEPATC